MTNRTKHYGADRYIPAWTPTPCTTIMSQTLCRSQLEAHVGDVLELTGTPVEHESILVRSTDIQYGRSKPDWITPDPANPEEDQVWIEAKGADRSARDTLQFDFYCELADKPESGVGKAVLVKRDFMKVHQDGQTKPGVFCKCADCGQWYFDFKASEHTCPACGGTNTTYIIEDMNKAGREMSKAAADKTSATKARQIEEKYDKEDEAADEERRMVNYLKNVRKALDWNDLQDGDKYNDTGIRIGSRLAYYEQCPDFVYEETPIKTTKIRSAMPPLVVVDCVEFIDGEPAEENQAFVFEELQEAIEKGHTFVKHVIVSHSGIQVLDYWLTNGEYVPGNLFKCDHCGKPYFAPSTAANCPYCSSSEIHRVSKHDHGVEAPEK